MSAYRKKPVVIEAEQVPERLGSAGLPELYDIARDIAKWCDGSITIPPGIDILTLEGVMHASPGDFIIRGVQGEFYPCKPDIFEATYEPVSTEATT